MDDALRPFQLELSRCLEPFYTSVVEAMNDEKSASFASCLRESYLWECQQLGVYTPNVLVYTMLYFNTKYFRLYTVEQHEQFSFANVQKITKKVAVSDRTATPKGAQKVACLQYYSPSTKRNCHHLMLRAICVYVTEL